MRNAQMEGLEARKTQAKGKVGSFFFHTTPSATIHPALLLLDTEPIFLVIEGVVRRCSLAAKKSH